MPTALKLNHRNPITYESALQKDANIISQAAHLEAATELYQSLWDQRQIIKALFKHHLRLTNRDTCIVNAQDRWIRGSFNICIPIEVRSARFHEKLIFRCPMPHKLAEAKYPGTVDEKLSSEVGIYAWMQYQCPDIRIPHLYGFGFSDHRHFVYEQQRPFYIRLWRMSQRGLLLRCPTLSYYTAHSTSQRLPTAYMLLEYIGPNTGKMLSNTWEKHRNDPMRRQNLFRGMSRLILSLARIPQHRIGSFQFQTDGTITLTNRPLPCSVIILENDGYFSCPLSLTSFSLSSFPLSSLFFFLSSLSFLVLSPDEFTISKFNDLACPQVLEHLVLQVEFLGAAVHRADLRTYTGVGRRELASDRKVTTDWEMGEPKPAPGQNGIASSNQLATGM